MTSKLIAVGMAAVLVCGFLLAAPQGREIKPKEQQGVAKKPLVKWEYKVVNGTLKEERLNELGNEGWELVSVSGRQPFVTKATTPAKTSRYITSTIEYTPVTNYFKRVKQ